MPKAGVHIWVPCTKQASKAGHYIKQELGERRWSHTTHTHTYFAHRRHSSRSTRQRSTCQGAAWQLRQVTVSTCSSICCVATVWAWLVIAIVIYIYFSIVLLAIGRHLLQAPCECDSASSTNFNINVRVSNNRISLQIRRCLRINSAICL